MKYEAILFDLDGTLLDSAPDLLGTLDEFLAEYDKPACDHQLLRQYVSDGSRTLIQLGFGDDLPMPLYDFWQQHYLPRYQERNTQNSNLYQGVEELLSAIEKTNTPWAIVTNKYTKPTEPIVKHFKLDQRAEAIVCGDTLPVEKPDPSPLILACEMMGVNPKNCVYIGDSHSDMMAGNLAEMTTIACAYGYIKTDDDMKQWEADYIVQNPSEILALL